LKIKELWFLKPVGIGVGRWEIKVGREKEVDREADGG
jgi:hypothetical protein